MSMRWFHPSWSIKWLVVLMALSTWGPTSTAASPDGLHLMTRFWGGSLEMKVWYFSNDRFAQEPRSTATPFDFNQAEQQSPGSTGRITRQGDRWTFEWAQGRKSTGKHERGQGAGGCFYWDAGLFCPVKPFASQQVLDGTYAGSLGTSQVSSARTYIFSPDGRYRMRTAASVSSTGPTVWMSGGAGSEQEGRYRTAGQAIVLTPTGSPAMTLTAFPYEVGTDLTKPGRVYIGGFMLKRQAP